MLHRANVASKVRADPERQQCLFTPFWLAHPSPLSSSAQKQNLRPDDFPPIVVSRENQLQESITHELHVKIQKKSVEKTRKYNLKIILKFAELSYYSIQSYIFHS